MARYELMKGLPVVTMAEGKQVGKVEDLVVDPESKAVRWLRIHRGGMLSAERLWVSVDAVHGLGEHAITINAEADLRANADAPEADALLRAKRRVIGNVVMTEDGQRLGEVRDYEFAPDTFALTSLSVPKSGNVLNSSLTIPADKVLVLTIPADRVITIGEDMIVVASAALPGSEEKADAIPATTTNHIEEKTE